MNEEEEIEEEVAETQDTSPFTEKNGKYYYYVDGKMKTGWQTVDGKTYYFRKSGSTKGQMYEGKRTVAGKWYFFGPDRKTGFIWNGNALYYGAGDGVLRTGWQTVGGNRYYFWGQTQNGHIHREAALGVKSVNGTFYLFSPEDGRLLYGLNEHNNTLFYTNSKGVLQKGWQTIDGVKYYFNAKKKKYEAHQGKLTVKGRPYICNRGVVLKGLIDFEGEYYFGDETGLLQTGWQTIDGKKYYFLPGATDTQPIRAAVKGAYPIGKCTYFFDENGVLDESKTIYTGLVEKDGTWHFYYPTAENGHEAGEMAKEPVYYEGNYYWFDENGDAVNGWHTIDGEYTYFDEKGMYVKTKGAMELTVIDYGTTNGSYGANYGDPTILESDGEYLLVDTCMPDGAKVIIKKLKDLGIKKLSVYVSHFHQDHDGALPKILRDSYFNVEKIYFPDTSYMYGNNKNTKWFKTGRNPMEESISLAKKKNIPVVTITPGDTFEVGFVQAKVLYKQENPKFTGNASDHGQVTTYINNQSLLTRFECGGISFLHGGDIETGAEKEILKKGIDISADIFKLSHHGGAGSNTSNFLKAVNAKVFYYSNPGDTTKLRQDGWSAGIINNVQKMGGNVFHPIVNGTTTFTVSGGGIYIKTARRSKTVNVPVINKLTGKKETIKVTVQGAEKSTYKVHENMIPFYYDLQ